MPAANPRCVSKEDKCATLSTNWLVTFAMLTVMFKLFEAGTNSLLRIDESPAETANEPSDSNLKTARR